MAVTLPDPGDEPGSWPQVVPRPSTARPGRPAPWEGVAPAARRGLSLGVVEAALDRAGQSGAVPPPGDGPHPFDTAPPPEPVASSAVLVALYEEGGEARTVLTRRSATLRAHRGEVSFPGGRVDPGESVADAARREAAEEVALDPASVRLVGWLHPVLTYSSSSLIVPVVGVLDARPTLVANPDEVARAFDVALADLVADGTFHEERWSIPGRPVPGSPDGSFPIWFFEVAGETVWGATARMLFELLCLVLGVDPTTG